MSLYHDIFTSQKHIWKMYWWLILPFGGFYIGHQIDLMETKRMTMFRDKSALYGREMKPGEPPSWPY
ncbi:PREDICTED: NADH dehydrogenase [ubiquinone] 1 beta subcomplex subunit 1 [Dinoponera quadriceps]|uniref:NADH dehydrogenase [ubiquinone] 1 beta subcomplex subunit 1 n=1 Tax=Dinoponera quadriceps TaxID=609295 RepID=A0A6P3XYG8_DINQU|nr:PREDICTED: NADH dehydrogenase [ubiquinone] 1 beta subcomplex subunit 1 [Dinoponera quadriceps]